jgi:hypothetical protein
MELTKQLKDFIAMDKERDPFFNEFRRFYCLDTMDKYHNMKSYSNGIVESIQRRLPFPKIEIVYTDSYEDMSFLNSVCLEECNEDENLGYILYRSNNLTSIDDFKRRGMRVSPNVSKQISQMNKFYTKYCGNTRNGIIQSNTYIDEAEKNKDPLWKFSNNLNFKLFYKDFANDSLTPFDWIVLGYDKDAQKLKNGVYAPEIFDVFHIVTFEENSDEVFIRSKIDSPSMLFYKNYRNYGIAILRTINVVINFLNLINCRNTVVKEAKYSKINIMRLKPASKKFYYIDIKDKAKYIKANEELKKEAEVSKKKAHTCRGHIAHYSADAPLFGHIVGDFWIPPHVRGVGMVEEKPYRVLGEDC